jgi:hypothetical protein
MRTCTGKCRKRKSITQFIGVSTMYNQCTPRALKQECDFVILKEGIETLRHAPFCASVH